jgi:hypothetical protein
MSTRYLSNLILAVISGFLVVATMSFTAIAAAWVTFGIAIATLLISAAIMAPVRHGLVQRVLGAAAGVISVWTIIASLVFAPSTVVWLGFASAIALVALAVAGLTLHELTTERVVHALAVEREPVIVAEPAGV